MGCRKESKEMCSSVDDDEGKSLTILMDVGKSGRKIEKAENGGELFLCRVASVALNLIKRKRSPKRPCEQNRKWPHARVSTNAPATPSMHGTYQ